MINNIINAIAKNISAAFGKSYYIYSEEVNQGFKYPCFSIKHISSEVQKGIGERVKHINSFVIRYFPKDDLKNNDMAQVSQKLFDCLEFIYTPRIIRGVNRHSDKSSAINLNNFSSEYENGDGILNFYVDFNFHDVKKEAFPFMEMLKAIPHN